MSMRRCRLCLAERDFSTSLWGAHAHNTNFRDKLQICLGLHVCEADPLRSACYRCVYRVEEFYNLIIGMKEVDAKLEEERHNNALNMDASQIINKNHQANKPTKRVEAKARTMKNNSVDMFDEEVLLSKKFGRKCPTQSESDVSLLLNGKLASVPKKQRFKPRKSSIDLFASKKFGRKCPTQSESDVSLLLNGKLASVPKKQRFKPRKSSIDLFATQSPDFNSPKEDNVFNNFEAAFNLIHEVNENGGQKINANESPKDIELQNEDENDSEPFSLLHSELRNEQQSLLHTGIPKLGIVFGNPKKTVRKSNQRTPINTEHRKRRNGTQDFLPEQNRKMKTRLHSKDLFESQNDDCNKLNDSWKVIPDEGDEEIFRKIRNRLLSRPLFE